MNGKRKLSAILFADIVGYTKLMQQSESSGLDALDKFKGIVNETVPKFDGEVVKSYGDGCLMLFDVPSSAIQCALAMQQAFRKGKSIPVRIGAHIGEVIQTEDDYYGDGINIASRLESLAEPNSVLLSRAMKDQISNKAFADTAFIGNVNLKNVEDIQEIYALSNKGLTVPESTEHQSDASFVPDGPGDPAFEKKKKAFGSLAGLGIAAMIMFVGFGLIGITPGRAVSILVLLIITFLVMMYFLMFGMRFDVFGGGADQVGAADPRKVVEDEDIGDGALDLKELDAQRRDYDKKDFI